MGQMIISVLLLLCGFVGVFNLVRWMLSVEERLKELEEEEAWRN